MNLGFLAFAVWPDFCAFVLEAKPRMLVYVWLQLLSKVGTSLLTSVTKGGSEDPRGLISSRLSGISISYFYYFEGLGRFGLFSVEIFFSPTKPLLSTSVSNSSLYCVIFYCVMPNWEFSVTGKFWFLAIWEERYSLSKLFSIVNCLMRSLLDTISEDGIYSSISFLWLWSL